MEADFSVRRWHVLHCIYFKVDVFKHESIYNYDTYESVT